MDVSSFGALPRRRVSSGESPWRPSEETVVAADPVEPSSISAFSDLVALIWICFSVSLDVVVTESEREFPLVVRGLILSSLELC
jgi:hypothetical protein